LEVSDSQTFESKSFRKVFERQNNAVIGKLLHEEHVYIGKLLHEELHVYIGKLLHEEHVYI
jgi:hypothetical protein